MFRACSLLALVLGHTCAGAAEFRAASDEAVILYDAPSAQSQKLFVVNQGYPLEVVVTVQGWVKVRDASGALSWADARKVSTKSRSVMVKVAQASVRQTADDGAAVVFQAQQHVLLELLTEATGAWLRVKHRDGATGFIRASNVWGV